MRFITAKNISQEEFKNKEFQFFNSIREVLRNPSNANNLYILEVEEEKSFLKRVLFKKGISRNTVFKNYYMDCNKKIIKVIRKVELNEMISNGVKNDYFFKYATQNKDRLEENSLNIILDFLIRNHISNNLLITFCIKLPKCDIYKAEDYIISKYNDTDMIIEFANKVDNCNMDKITKYIINSNSSHLCVNLLKTVKLIENKNLNFDLIEDEIISKDNKGNLIYEMAREFNDFVNIDKLSKALIEKDKHGFICLTFANSIEGVDKKLFEKEIAKKDRVGTYCINLASNEDADREYLLDRVLELDKNNGAMALEYAKNIKDLSDDEI
ncbi:MAG: hypothetical protein IJH34_06960, partial [Romboutsia sp.]|nr:hypothetical protein [Romboutsia sp.]